MQTTKTRGRTLGSVPDTCPRCGGRDVLPILYGFPRKEEEGVFGGLYVAFDSPEWHCRDCGHEFGRFDPAY
jgi:hypothetical protein